MQNKIILIYIILESRLSFEDACELFKISKEELETIMNCCVNQTLHRALKYLFYCESKISSFSNPEKAKFKATLLYKKYLNILKIKNEEERKVKVNLFMKDLSGNRIESLKDKNKRYFTIEEKEFIFKHQIKFALTFRELEYFYNIHSQILLKWKNDLQDEQLKNRLKCLDEYKMSYFGVYGYKR